MPGLNGASRPGGWLVRIAVGAGALVVASAVGVASAAVVSRSPAQPLIDPTTNSVRRIDAPDEIEPLRDLEPTRPSTQGFERPPPCAAEPPLPWRKPNDMSDAELARTFATSPAKLGSASIGTPTRGKLWGGVPLTSRDGLTTAGGHPFGTEGAVGGILRAVREVRRCHPKTPPLFVGDISRDTGGWLRPHKSHQSGLDADIGYYYTTAAVWFETATAANLDRPRTWRLVRALVEGGNVAAIFMDRALQKLLLEYAESIGEDEVVMGRIFGTDPQKKDGLLKHAHGHATHFHVRFDDPAAVALGRRIEPLLLARTAVKARPVKERWVPRVVGPASQ